MTDKEHIQKLLDSYLAAETTREEEQLLSNYFCTHQDIPAEWHSYSVLFRGLRHAEPNLNAYHKNRRLRWIAAAAAIVVVLVITGIGCWVLGDGGYLVHKLSTNTCHPTLITHHSTEKPAVSQLIEPLHKPIIDKPAQTKQISKAKTRKHRIRKSSKPAVTKTPVEEYDINNSIEDNSPIEVKTRSLTIHRERMRNSIQATFDNPTIFITENNVEL